MLSFYVIVFRTGKSNSKHMRTHDHDHDITNAVMNVEYLTFRRGS